MIGILEQMKVAGGGGGGGSIPTSGALYLLSLMKINPSYSGFCLRVKRASDSTTLDVGFVSDYIDEAAIAAFCSGTTGHVSRWYDQAGTGNVFSNDAGALSTVPKIYQSGAFFTDNGKRGVNFTGSEALVSSLPTFPVTSFKSSFAVVRMSALLSVNYLLFAGTPSVDGIYLGGTAGGVTGFGVVKNNTVKNQNTIENLNRNLHTYIGTSPKKVYTNGANLATETGSTSDMVLVNISRAGFSINGNLQELLIYSTDKDSERVAIETDINSRYTIY